MFRHDSPPKRHPSSSKMGPMTFILTATVVMLLILSAVKAKEVLYLLGEAGTRGSEVLLAIPGAASKSMCAAACTSASGCLGFNWMAMATIKCQLLSSLRVVVADASCALFVPEVFARTAIKLEFSCPSCMGIAPFAGETWQHSCANNDLIAGLASVTSFPDLDYMLCIKYQGLLIITSNGYTCTDDGRGCNTITLFPNIAPNCIWSDTQYYDPSGSKRYACRQITSWHKVDVARCKNATQTFGYTTGIPTPVKMLLCPPHMVAQRFYASTTIPAYVTCCLLY